METPIRMTEYSHGSGCGCKIAPAVLDVILHSQLPPDVCDALLVGNSSRDDAAVYDLGNGKAVISTTDFFMPIVDDPFTFGRIAATNAISDVYAMGGKPIMAIAIFGWPLDKLPPEVGREVVEGGRKACQDAGIPLAGGHSIDAPEPIFGLAVTGIVQTRHLKQNSTAQAGCKLYLTKPLGIGILTTAQKRKVLLPEHSNLAIDTMCRMNSIGAQFGEIPAVTALTDVTGFGLGGTFARNVRRQRLASSYSVRPSAGIATHPPIFRHGLLTGRRTTQFRQLRLCAGGNDRTPAANHLRPQTSGGLLVALAPEGEAEFLAVCQQAGLDLQPIGYLREPVAGNALITLE
ncbi:selenide, water dikinase SelD [Thiothrix subterranea]|uniref:selenide, water dikinase SelD n=1 Tax=Thiothrix subterranea TaxID=2735563 RepID=UPI00280C089A|nr:selenide, water dikinase SelD [Thiothrix subterranea]